MAEQTRVDDALRALTVPGGATVEVEGGVNRPPLEEALAADLLAVARRAAGRCGLAAAGRRPGRRRVGRQLHRALGVPTLDGLGAVGDGAHAEGEHVLVPTMPERAALLAALLVELAGAHSLTRASRVRGGRAPHQGERTLSASIVTITRTLGRPP